MMTTNNSNNVEVLEGAEGKSLGEILAEEGGGPFPREHVLEMIRQNKLNLLAVASARKRIDWSDKDVRAEAARTGVLFPRVRLERGFALRPHQKKAAAWMRARERRGHPLGLRGGIVCMQMGMGKTLTALWHALTSQQRNHELFPTLIVASKTVMGVWQRDGFEKFFPKAKVFYFHRDVAGDAAVQNVAAGELRAHHCVVTTYDVLLSAYKQHVEGSPAISGGFVRRSQPDADGATKVLRVDVRPRPAFRAELSGLEALVHMPWERVICDESQVFANPKTATFQAVMAVSARWRFCLSGTPVRNAVQDVWAQLRFCGLDRPTRPNEWSVDVYRALGLQQSAVLHMGYADARVELPRLHHHDHDVPMDPTQLKVYAGLLRYVDDNFDAILADEGGQMMVLALLTRLRQVCVTPHSIVDTAATLGGSSSGDAAEPTPETLFSDPEVAAWLRDRAGTAGALAPKVSKVVEILDAATASDEKVLVFTMFSRGMDLVVEHLQRHRPDVGFRRVDGSVLGQKRSQAILDFQRDPSVRLMLLQGKIGAEGLNLTEATHVVIMMPHWNDATHRQMIARSWRTGQTRDVHVHWLRVAHSIEDAIFGLCRFKKETSDAILKRGDEPTERASGSLSMEQIRSLIQRSVAASEGRHHPHRHTAPFPPSDLPPPVPPQRRGGAFRPPSVAVHKQGWRRQTVHKQGWRRQTTTARA